MANLEITNNVPDGLVILDPLHQEEIIIAAGAVTWPAGTVMGRLTASGKLTPYLSGGVLGEDIPIAILFEEEVFTGAGERTVRPLISGHVRLERLTAFGVGAITQAEADLLRDFTIIPRTTQDLTEQDNQ